ncbi:restriction endonuclease subunit S [Yoonia algicola]|uniref:Restriction endonuclease subunit S n=1 Tax=Yoonia algicola TaxID=3137368 RepID=A0AAN0NIN4_9RHOB
MKDVAKKGWETRLLGEVCKLVNGRAYKKPELLDDGPYPVLRVGNFFTNNHWYYSDLELDEDKYCDDGDLLYAWSASFGPRIWEGGKVIYHYHIWKVLPSDRVDRDFLYYFFDWDKELIKKEQGAGATMIHVSKGSMEARAMPLPPLEEQQRIVAVLDEAFEGLARARAHAEANLSDAEQIAARSLDVILEDLSTRNGRITVQEIAAVKGGKRLPKGSKPGPTPTPHPYISVKDLTEDGTVSTAKLGYISAQVQRSIARYTISSRDVYISIAGTIGKSGIVPDELDEANLTENAAKLVLTDGWATEYVYWCTRSADFAVQTSEQTRVAAQPKLALQRLGAITIPKATEAEQIAVCEKMNALRVTRSELVEAYSKKLQDLDDLRQSLLQKAFAGELT